MKKPWYKRTRLIFVLVMILSIVSVFLFVAWTPSITDDKGFVLPGSVASLEQIELGGIKQSILIRGNSKNNPILLFLHGGPGYPQIAYARKYQQQLEKDFIVVNWDQRGSGKSYHFDLTDEDMQVGKLIADTHELTQYLRDKFNRPKIFIAGHSWGSLLGIRTVQQYPENYYAYIGIGQVANSPEGERLSYEFVLQEAKKRNNAEAIRQLEAIGAPPYANPRKDATLERKWVHEFGGSERLSDSYGDLIGGMLLSPEYTWLDAIRMAVGNGFSAQAILPQTANTNLFETLPELKVPVYICMGRYDYMTPSEVAYQYYEKLIAPSKQFIWFEQSAHFPQFEEVDKFSQLMAKIKEEIFKPAGL